MVRPEALQHAGCQRQHRHQQDEHAGQQQRRSGAFGIAACVAILQPLPGDDRQRGRRGRANDECQVDHRQAIGQHRQHRPGQARQQQGPQDAPPDGPVAVAQRAATGQPAAQLQAQFGPRQQGHRVPQQERRLLGHQHQRQREAARVVEGRPVGRRVITQRQREQARQQARRHDEQGQTDGKGRMGHCQHRPQGAGQAFKGARAMQLRHQPQRQRQRDQGRDQRGAQR